MIHIKEKKCLLVNIIVKLIACWDINQVTSKCHMDFLDNTCKKTSKAEKKNITIEFYIFKLACVPNFSFNKQF